MSKGILTIDGELPKDWEVVKLGDVLSLEYGKGLPENKRLEGKFPVYGSNGIVGYHEQFLVKGPGIVVGRKGTIGAVTWVDSDFWPIDTTYFVKTKNENVFLKWLFFNLKQSNLPRLSQSDVVPGLKRELVYHITIPLPPLSEQRRIAEVLGTVDSAIQRVGGAIEKTERLKKGLMQRLLTQGIGHERFKETEVGRVPEEWEVARLGDITDVMVGYVGPISEFYVTGGEKIPLLSTTNVSENGIKLKDLKYVTPEFHKGNKKSQIFPRDIIIARHGISGTAAVIPDTVKEAHCLNVVIVRHSEKFESEFIGYLFNFKSIRDRLIGWKSGSVQGVVNTKVLEKFKILLPPLPEQRRIAEILSAVDRKLELERRRKEKLERVKKGLMNELLTGKKRVKA